MPGLLLTNYDWNDNSSSQCSMVTDGLIDSVSRIIEALAIERKPLSVFMHIKFVSMYTDNLEVLWLIPGSHTPVQLVEAMEVVYELDYS